MKYHVIISIMLFLIGVSAAEEVPRLHSEYDPQKWPEARLKLSQAATLKDIFDSGLRPYAHPGLENSLLEVKHLNLVVQMGSGKMLPPIQAEVVNITPFKDGEIATIEGFTPRLTIEQARKEILKWLPYAENKRTEAELDQYFKAVESDFFDFDDPYRGVSHGCSVIWKEPNWKKSGGGPQVVFWFRKTAGIDQPLRLYFKFSWSSNRPQKDRGTYRPDPIPPPPGYEHVSMEAPKDFGPDSEVNIMRSKGINIGDGKGGITQEEYLRRQAESKKREDKKTNSAQSVESAAKTANYWLWLLLVPFLVLIWRFKMKLSKR